MSRFSCAIVSAGLEGCTNPKRGAIAVALLSLSVLTACTPTRPAPVVDRTTTPSAGSARAERVRAMPAPVVGAPVAPAAAGGPTSVPPGVSPAVPSSGVHVVQRGENLYRIALNYGLDMNALAAWNGMTTSQPLREGQTLRLTPPPAGGVVQTAPAAPTAAPVIAQPLPPPSVPVSPPSTSPTAPPPPPVAAAPADIPSRREPRAQRVPYSDAAFAEMQREGRARAATDLAPSAAASAPSGAAASPSAPPGGAESDVRPGPSVERDGVRWTWPTTGRVVSKFNERAPLKGIEIAAPVGTPVVAAAAGKVIFVGQELRGCGQMVVISHGEGVVSVYCHLGKIAVREQQRVTLGQRIAEVSDSGNARLHFEIRKQGRPLDPATLLPR